MASSAIFLPDATNLDVHSIKPSLELQSCNHLLDDYAALMRFHDEEGYLLLRNVLNPQSVMQARTEMFAVMAKLGLIHEDAEEPIWTGVPFAGGMEESPEFSGISSRLIHHPDNLKIMEKILGEPASMVPIVQYRTYPPGGPVTGVHQDGFFSPGVQKFKPVWMPLTNTEREVGGLMLAVRQCNKGFFHNVAKSPPSIPEGVIPDDVWATSDYYPGDVLILNPMTPHCSQPNRSNRCRVSIDTRVQSSKDPRILIADVTAIEADAIHVLGKDGKKRQFIVDCDTFIRIENPGVRQSVEEYLQKTKIGQTIVVVFDGDHAQTLRKASEN